MKITQIRESEGVEALSIIELNLLIEKMKTEIKAKPVSNLRYGLQFMLPGNKCSYAEKLPKVIPAAAYSRVGGVKRMRTYNGIVELSVGPLSGKPEVERVKQKAAELPQTLAAFMGSSGKSVKIWVRFIRPDGKLPTGEEEAELFHAHAYQLAVKCYQPQLPFDIALKEPRLDQYSRLTCDPDLIYRPDAVPFYLSQPVGMPVETLIPRTDSDKPESPLARAVPGYDTCDAMAMLYEAALHETFGELENWCREDDLQPLVVRLAEKCFRSGLPQEEVVRRTIDRYHRQEQEMLIRQMIGNVYDECKGFGTRNSLSKEQRLSLQIDEFMKRRFEFRFNTQVGDVEFRERNSFRFYFQPVDERVMNSISMDAQCEGIGLWDRDVKRYIHSNRVKTYNPIEEFLADLPRWDGTDRIRQLAARVPCDNPHWNQLFYRWFLNMVAHWRGYDKKHANSTSPLLVGAQGFRKSTYCRDIMPPELRAYFTDSIDFGRKRDAELYLNRFALINIDEFDQVTLTQQGFLKHILQKPVVNLRKPYGSSVQELRRYASFIGTSNQRDLLSDPSGSRRFICIEVTGVIDTSQPIDYRQLYAQAIHALYKGERYWFDYEEEKILTENNRAFEQIPAIEQLFHQYFRAVEPDEEGEALSPVEILEYIQKRSSIPLSVSKINHFGRLLQKNGIHATHTRKGNVYRVVKL